MVSSTSTFPSFSLTISRYFRLVIQEFGHSRYLGHAYIKGIRPWFLTDRGTALFG